MKKLIAIAALALCATAQAVTYTWSNWNGSAGDADGAYNFTTTHHASLCLAPANIATTDMPIAGTVLLTQIEIANRSTNANSSYTTIKVYDGNTVVATSQSVTSTTETMTVTATNGDNLTVKKCVILFNKDELDVTKTYTLKAYDADGAECNMGATVIREADSNSYPWWAAMEVSADSVPLPEPTVLALLALGVAGVALKRKVA